MAARHYHQFFGESATDVGNGYTPPADQDGEDDLRFASTPALILSGEFRLYYRPWYDSSYITESGEWGSRRTLLSVDSVDGMLEFAVYNSSAGGATSSVAVALDGVILVEQEVTFSAKQELTLTFDAAAGTVTAAGATTGNGTATGDTWDVADGEMRLGGLVDSGMSARGWVSIPYAVV